MILERAMVMRSHFGGYVDGLRDLILELPPLKAP
jgi:hypothetical protein